MYEATVYNAPSHHRVPAPSFSSPEQSRRDRLVSAALAVPFAVFLIVYAPAVGHGFISDDFRWIVESRIDRPADAVDLFSRHTGFYRPAVALTFAADYALFGARPLGYGLTNLALAIGCAVLLLLLLRSLGMPVAAAVFGGSLWLLNFHGIAMALLWISGRTALVLSAASLATAVALLRGRFVVAVLCLLIALLAKEEAVTLPLTLACWLSVLGGEPATRPRIRIGPWLIASFALLSMYTVLRLHSGALTPASAPPYYRFTFAAAPVARHMLQYADRSLTLPAAACLAALLLLRPFGRPLAISWRLVVCGLAWLIGGHALTLFLPVPSSLYACFPSIGACLIAAEICLKLWRQSADRARLRTAAAGIAIIIALIPVYRARSHRWTDLADFSTSVLDQLATFTARVPDNAAVVLVDERTRRVNLEAAFGTLLSDAHRLKTGRTLAFWVEPPLTNAHLAGLRPPCAGCAALTLQLREGILSRVGSVNGRAAP